MKLTNREIITTFNALDSLGETEMPIAMTYKVVNNIDKLLHAYQVFERARQKAKNEDEINELLEIESEIDIETISRAELFEAGIKLKPVQLVGIKRIIDG